MISAYGLLPVARRVHLFALVRPNISLDPLAAGLYNVTVSKQNERGS
ncbi:MAG: hypothetical protein ACREBS_02435 [Nitrososphaerales archaeon]